MVDSKLLITILLNLLPILYGITFFNYVLVFFTEDKTVRRLARPLLWTSVIANAIYLLGFTLFFEHLPLVNVFQVMGAVGFAVAATYLWVETKTGSPYTGPFVLVLVLLFQVMNAVFPKLDREVPDLLQSMLFNIHVSAAVIGYSAFAVSAVYGLLYLLLYYNMRAKSFGLVFRRLPSLDILDRMNTYAAAAGLAPLTVALIMGAWWSIRVFGTVSLDPKILVAVITWILYAVALSGRRLTGWTGVRMAYTTLLGFALMLFSMFAVNFLLSGFHVFTG